MFNANSIFHKLDLSSEVELPTKIDYPFQYTPSEVGKIAAEELQCYLSLQTDFNGRFEELGKMFGVLIVKDILGNIGYLSAFSGKIDERVCIDGFVPPVFDTIDPNGFVKITEAKLNIINSAVDEFESKSEYILLKENLIANRKQQELEISNLREANRIAKLNRKKKRLEAEVILDKESLDNLILELKNESIRLNYEFKDLKRSWLRKIADLELALKVFEKPLLALKQKRKLMSSMMQDRIHSSYCFLNANGEQKDLTTIFNEIEFRLPSGTGECCAPKLFQYAFQHNYKPIALAEFWWGKSPSSEIKTHKEYYPCCKGKCKPVLNWMLQGLDVNPNPVKNRENIILDIKYEDDDLLVIVKPYRFLSVPGKEIEDSVYTRMKKRYPDSTGAIMVHRLDMGTSGLMVIAKKAEIHKQLQKQFIERTVKKRYVAILDGLVKDDEGVINLPLRVDYNNRPRQIVCFEKGRPSVTHFKVVERKNNKTKIFLYPETGRTHQLRMHCAHHLGLGRVIYGDDLYGVSKDRLYLHAEELEFTHPTTNERLNFLVDSEFCID